MHYELNSHFTKTQSSSVDRRSPKLQTLGECNYRLVYLLKCFFTDKELLRLLVTV